MTDFRTNKHVELLKVGDRVVTDFNRTPNVVLEISQIVKSKSYESGYGIMAIGKTCKHCGATPYSVGMVDGSWFLPAKEQATHK